MSHLHYHIETFGCQMNVYDSELIAGLLQKCGYSETEDMNKADIIFLNTCSIREKAEETVHHRLESIHYLKKRNPKIILGVLGCMAQNLKDDLLESKPYIDVILGPDSYRRTPEIINIPLLHNIVLIFLCIISGIFGLIWNEPISSTSSITIMPFLFMPFFIDIFY